jgi:hypothetical protein
MRVIRGTYGDAVAWRAQRRALEDTRAAGLDRPVVEPAVVVSGPDEHAEGAGVLVEAVGPDGVVIYRRFIREDVRAVARPEDAVEAAIQEAWRRLVRHIGSPETDVMP